MACVFIFRQSCCISILREWSVDFIYIFRAEEDQHLQDYYAPVLAANKKEKAFMLDNDLYEAS